MHRSHPTGLKTRHLLAQTLRSCLPGSLPYNWDHKLHGLIVDICLARSLMLQSIAQVRFGHVRTRENILSGFLSQERLNLSGPQEACVRRALKRIGRRRLWRHAGKIVLVLDATSYAKTRSRGKNRPMPGKGQVRMHNLAGKETILAPGYQEIWIGVLLKDRSVLPLTRRLWSERGPAGISLNLVEEVEIRRAVALVRETLGMDVILVADSGYRRKDLLHWLQATEIVDFVIRLEGKLLVRAGRGRGLLEDLSEWWPRRIQIQWREKSKRVLLSNVSARAVWTRTEAKERLDFNAVRLTPTKPDVEPMYLATTLAIDTREQLTLIVRLYSWRWGIETFFWNFKQAFRADSWRVFSSWEAIDRLLTAAHLAYLMLIIMFIFAKTAARDSTRKLMRQFVELLRNRFARPVEEMTLGRFLRMIATDFLSPYAVLPLESL